MNDIEPEGFDDDELEIIAYARRNLRTRLMGAGFLRPGRQRSEEDIAKEQQIRRESQDACDAAIIRHRQKKTKKS